MRWSVYQDFLFSPIHNVPFGTEFRYFVKILYYRFKYFYLDEIFVLGGKNVQERFGIWYNPFVSIC